MNYPVLFVLMAASFVSLAQADTVIAPTKGESWGESNPTDALLKMNKDPEQVKQTDSDTVSMEPVPTKNGDAQTEKPGAALLFNSKKKKPN